MFSGSFREATTKRQVIKNVSADAFEELLSFIYTGELRNEDFPIDDLISIADYYEVKDLVKVCEAKLLKDVNEDNAEIAFCIASNIECNSELKKIAFQILQS